MSEVIKGAGKSKLRLYLATALLLSLAVTGGLFAYAYTQASQQIVVSGTADFAVIDGYCDPPTYSIFGKYRGALPTGDLFSVNLTTNYPGDVAVNVYLDNIDELGKNYGLWLMRLKFVRASDDKNMDCGPDIAKVLSLRNGVVTFVSHNVTYDEEYRIQSMGGVYRAHPWAYINTVGGMVNPSLTAEVLQAE